MTQHPAQIMQSRCTLELLPIDMHIHTYVNNCIYIYTLYNMYYIQTVYTTGAQRDDAKFLKVVLWQDWGPFHAHGTAPFGKQWLVCTCVACCHAFTGVDKNSGAALLMAQHLLGDLWLCLCVCVSFGMLFIGVVPLTVWRDKFIDLSGSNG